MSSVPICIVCKKKCLDDTYSRYYNTCSRVCSTRIGIYPVPKCKTGCGNDCWFDDETYRYADVCGLRCLHKLHRSK